jgi:O-antigen/teichoic acid export membrane protein
VAVVVFSTLRTLTRLAMQMVMIVANATEPELATAHGAGDRQLLRNLFVHALRAGLWLALLAAVGLALFGGRVLELWTHGRVAMDGALLGWLLASAVASVLWLGGLTVLKAANRPLRAAAVYVFASAAAVGLAMALLYWTGELALAGMALLAMDAVMALYTIGAATHLLGERAWPLLLRVMDPRPVTALVYSRFSFWRQRHQSS